MSNTIKTLVCVAAVGLAALVAAPEASAQSPVAVTTTVPGVVGYSAEPAGLFGWRTNYRPIVAPVAVGPVTYVQPTYYSAKTYVPPVTYPAPVVRSYYVAPSTVVAPLPVTYSY